MVSRMESTDILGGGVGGRCYVEVGGGWGGGVMVGDGVSNLRKG